MAKIPKAPESSGEKGEPVSLGLQAQLQKKLDEKEILDEYTKDFKRLQKQKTRKTGGVEARVLTSRGFKWGEQYVSQNARGLVADTKEENKLHLVFNMIEAASSKLVGRLTAIGGQFHARPDKNTPAAKSEAEVCDRLILALDEIVEQPTRTWELVDTLITDGVAFEYTPWVPNATISPVVQKDPETGELLFVFSATGEIVPESAMSAIMASDPTIVPENFELHELAAPSGEVGSEILGALSVFIDQSVKSILDLAPDQAVYIAKIRTIGWIEENYGDYVDIAAIEDKLDGELNIVTTSFFQEGDATASMFLKDLIPMFQGKQDEDDTVMAVVVERYQPMSKVNPRGKFSCFIPGVAILYDDANPYPEIPLTDFHFKPATSTFWTKDFVTDLIPPQKFVNKRMSQTGEQANASIYDKTLLGGSLSVKDLKPDGPQAIEKAITEQGVPLVQRVPGPQLPSWFLNSIEMTAKFFTQIAGGSDLFQETAFPGQMRGPMAIPLLQEILDSQWGPLYKHLGFQLARVKQMRLNRVKQFYPPVRTLHFVDRTQRDEVLEFHKDEVFGRGQNYNITVEQSSLIPEFKALKEMRLIERLASPLGVLYTDERTGGLDKSKIAAELQMGDFAREGREAQARTFATQIIEKLWKGLPVPPVLQFWDHEPMIDELESAMMTTEFLSASPPVQQVFIERWNQHSHFLQARAQMQQQAMMSQQMHTAVAQATQQAAAMAAAEATKETHTQMRTQDMVRAQSEQQQPQEQQRSQLPQGGPPPRQ